MTASTTTFRQMPITRYPPAQPYEIETRYRCIDAHHEGRTYNSWTGTTFCLCGRAQWPGNTAVPATCYEQAERDSTRADRVGTEARAYLDHVHTATKPPQ